MGACVRGFGARYCARLWIPRLLHFCTSAEAAEAFVSDPEYAPRARARQGGSDSRFQLIDDTDLAGTIPYLPKG